MSTLLEVFKQQCVMIEKTSEKFMETTLQNTMLVQKCALKQSSIYMQRLKPSNNMDWGWYMGSMKGAAPDRPTDYGKAYSYQLFGFCCEALGILQLPIGTIAVFDNGKLLEIINGDGQKIW